MLSAFLRWLRTETLGPQWLRTLRYWVWIYRRERSFVRRLRARENVATGSHSTPREDVRPWISIVMPVCDPPPKFLRRAIESVQAQCNPNWELCIADDASSNEAVLQVLREASNGDSRVKLLERDERGHISAATNSALTLASAPWVTFLDHDDLLAGHALTAIRSTLNRHPRARFLYSDEDKCDERGWRSEPHFKPGWNETLLMAQNYLAHLSIYRRDDVERVGGFRQGVEGSQDYDLALRVTATLEREQIVHIPQVLYHWRAIVGSTARVVDAKDYATAAGLKALTDRFEGRPDVLVDAGPVPTTYRVRYRLPNAAPTVSIIVPTRDRARLLQQCVEGVLNLTRYPGCLEGLVVDNDSTDPEALTFLERIADMPSVKVLHWEGAFNYSAINNFAVSTATGDVLCFLNNDIEVVDENWLSELVSFAVRDGIGAVGAKLLYPDGRVQHGGVITGLRGVADHVHKCFSGADSGYFARLLLAQEMSAVTAACMVMKRSVFEAAGGFDAENLSVIFNDVELCLRLREQGLRNVWTPDAVLYHHESASRRSMLRGSPVLKRNANWMRKVWGRTLKSDPYWNPNLSLAHRDFRPR